MSEALKGVAGPRSHGSLRNPPYDSSDHFETMVEGFQALRSKYFARFSQFVANSMAFMLMVVWCLFAKIILLIESFIYTAGLFTWIRFLIYSQLICLSTYMAVIIFRFLTITVNGVYRVLWLWYSLVNWNGYQIVYVFLMHPVGEVLYGTFDANFRGLLATLCSNVSLLFLSLQEDIMATVGDAQGPELHEAELEEKIKQLIRYHQTIIKISHELKDVVYVSYFLDFVGAAIGIGIQGYFTIVGFDIEHIVFWLLHLGGLLLISHNAFNLHWSGQLVADMSEGVAYATYNCLWYTKSRRIKTLLNVIMIRSQTPVLLTASKFAILTLDNFRMIITEAWSYASLFTTLFSEVID